MKIPLLINIITYLSTITLASVSAYAQSTFIDYYFNNASSNGKLDNVANYNVGSPSGEVATTLPTVNTNVYFNDVVNDFTANTNYRNFAAHNVTFTVADAGTLGSGAWFMLTENNTATISGDFLFSARSAQNWSQIESGVKVLRNANFNVDGNFTINNNNIAAANNAGFVFAFKHHASDHTNGSVNIGGNLLFDAAVKGSSYASERIEMTTRVTNFTVQGYVDLTQPIVRGTVNNLIWDLKSAGDGSLGTLGYINIGGLRGDGALTMSKTASDVNLTFTNKVDSIWAGSLAVIDSTSKIYMTMNAENSAAKQTLRIAENSHDLDSTNKLALYNSTIHTPNSITVANGTLELNTAGNLNGKLILGSKLDGSSAKFGATGVSAGNEDGTLTFTSIVWNDGTFLFDVLPNIASGDLLNVISSENDLATGKLTVAEGASNLKMNFNISASDLKDYFTDNEVDALDQTIMTWETSSNIGDYLSQIEVDAGGVACELSVVGNSLVATFTVPEPSIFAAIFGLAVFGFALIRRRK